MTLLLPRLLLLSAVLSLALSGCAFPEMAEHAQQMTSEQFQQNFTDLQMCQLAIYYQSATLHFWGHGSQDFIDDFNRRGIICKQHDFYIEVIYTQQRIDAADDATCRSYGLAPGANGAYANCRLQLRAQRTGAAQTQQVIHAQQDADRAAAWRNLSTSGAALMQQSQPPPPAPPKDTYCVQAGSGISCRTQ
jgi:hypothetical protein